MRAGPRRKALSIDRQGTETLGAACALSEKLRGGARFLGRQMSAPYLDASAIIYLVEGAAVAWGDDLPIDARLPQDALHRRVVDAELARDGADGPLFPVIQPDDLRLGLLGDPRSSLRSRRSSGNARGPACPPSLGAAAWPGPERQALAAEEQRATSRIESSSSSFLPAVISGAEDDVGERVACVSV